MNSNLENLFDGIDAAVFSGDSFYDSATREKAREYIARWSRAFHDLESSMAGGEVHRMKVHLEFDISEGDGSLETVSQKAASIGDYLGSCVDGECTRVRWK